MSSPDPPPTTATGSLMGLGGAVAIAVGTMIGASIFSIFGLGAQIAGSNLPLVFVLCGALALLVAYSYATLGARIVSNAGPLEFILHGFGDGLLAGTLSLLIWFTYVVSIALFANGFSGYFLGATGLGGSPVAGDAVEVGVIVLFTIPGILGSRVVGRAESAIVLVKLVVLAAFIVPGLVTLHPAWLTPSLAPRQVGHTLEGVGIFFLAYMGFGLVTNASENMVDPERNVPRAIYLSLLVVGIVYVLVAVVAVGNVPVASLVSAREYALAEAARPFLGTAGYALVTAGALFSVSSALNATMYGGANIAYALARDGELPEAFERKLWFGASEGLYVTAGAAAVLTLTLDLGGIAAITSATYIVIYFFVLAAHYRLAPTFGGNRPIIVAGLVAVLAAFLLVLIYQWQNGRFVCYVSAGVFAAAFVIEVCYRRLSGRTLRPPPSRRARG